MKSAKPSRLELPVLDAGGDQDGAGAELPAARQVDQPAGALDAQADGVLHGQELGAEAARLVGRPAREVGAAEAHREAEVVLDPARLAGLAAGRVALDEHGAQALRRAVDGGGEARRAAADDDEVVVALRRLHLDAEALGELEHGRALEHARRPRAAPPAGAPRRRRSTCSSSRASPSRSTSIQRAGMPLRATKSRRSCESLEKRWPMMRRPPASSAAPDSHVVSRSSSTGKSLSSGGSQGLRR